jgi:hypothetical protein
MLAAMAGRGPKPKSKTATRPPAPRPTSVRRDVPPALRRRGWLELAGGAMLVLAACVLTMSAVDDAELTIGAFALVYVLALCGIFALAIGAARVDSRPETPVRADKRRLIYGVISLAFAAGHALIVWFVIPNRLPSAMLHLATIPIFILVMAIGTLVGARFGWWLAVIGGSAVLLSTILMIARILVSVVFLSGVYGAFGKGASMFALTTVALIVEVVALLPLCQVKFLMSRAGRRACGV